MFLKSEKVIKEWTDYNGHLNDSNCQPDIL